jgi:uncharacterized membrane protein YqjE
MKPLTLSFTALATVSLVAAVIVAYADPFSDEVNQNAFYCISIVCLVSALIAGISNDKQK